MTPNSVEGTTRLSAAVAPEDHTPTQCEKDGSQQNLLALLHAFGHAFDL